MTPKSIAAAACVLALSLAILSACESDTPSENASEPQKATASTSTTGAKPTPEPTATANPTITVVCTGPKSTDPEIEFTIDRVKPDWKEIWATNIPFDKKLGIQYCDDSQGYFATGEDGPKLKPVSPGEQKIWDLARRHAGGFGSPCEPECARDRLTLAGPYVSCVQHDSPEYTDGYPSGPHEDDIKTMLILCPNHPNAAALRKVANIRDGNDQQVANGEAINRDGTYTIGQEYPPGTYQTLTGNGSAGFTCYWARKTSGGKLLESGDADVDNGPGTETVALRSGESFYTESCGVWYRIR